MDDTWFSAVADELARCLVDAERCADACERLLEASRNAPERRAVAEAVLVPAAVARVLLGVYEQPQPVAAAAAALCRDAALAAADALEALDGSLDVRDAGTALRACAESCAGLLDA